MGTVALLLTPRLLSAKNRGRSETGGSWLRVAVLGTVGTVFWAGIFAVTLKVLFYFRGIEEVGEVIAFKLLSMLLITALALLIFSAILTALSRLYLSRDLSLVHSLPVPAHQVFVARWIDATVESAWMVGVYALPVFIGYGIVWEAAAGYYLIMAANLLGLCLVASSLSALLVMAAVMIIPASRMRGIFVFLGIAAFVLLYLAIRLLKPEQLVDPDVFITALVYLKNLETPASPLLPSTWVYDSLRAALRGQYGSAFFHLSLIASFAGLMVWIIIVVADRIYFSGYSKTQTAAVRLISRRQGPNPILARLPGPVQALATKEIKTFFRDQTQWSQIFLIAALVIIYVYNFKVLPLDRAPVRTVYLQNLLAFLNMGLALFVLTAVTARFAFPAVSLEGPAFWIIRSAPIPIRTFLRIKLAVYYLPLLILTEVLVVATNILLQVTPFMMVLSTVTVFFMVPAVVSLGIGFGAAYPDFGAENPAQTVTSYGGVLFMILAAGLIAAVILLEAGPVYRIFMAGIHDRPLTVLERLWTLAAFALALGLSVTGVLFPLKFGERRLDQLRTGK